MEKYRCDIMITAAGRRIQCQRRAAWVADDGEENHYFCAGHMPTDWKPFRHVYVIKNGDLVETGVTRVPNAVGEPIPSTIYTRAVEKLHDKLIAHALGFIWDPPKPEELIPYEATVEKGDR